VFLASLALYTKFGAGWSIFAIAFLAPDLSFIGYVAGARFGSIAYNAAHSYVGPVACLALWLQMQSDPWPAAALIWAAHVGFDRALGYGLKYAAGFGFTHLGPIGRHRQSAQ
jgi:hypothetical protein